jgi:hypothetical protein
MDEMEINPLHILWSNSHSFMEPLSVPDPSVTVFGEVTMFHTAAMAIVSGDPLGLEVALKSGQVRNSVSWIPFLARGQRKGVPTLVCISPYGLANNHSQS